MGVEPADLLAKVSQVLRHAVDHLTPGAQVADTVQRGGFNFGMLEGLAGKRLGANKG